MHVLFVHSNFPAQFRYLAPRLARDLGWRCTFVTRNKTAADLPGVERVLYRKLGAGAANHPFARYFDDTIRDAHGVYEALKARPDIRPDVVVAHSGFGSSLFLPHLYDAPVVNFFEYYYHAEGGAFRYRPEFPVTEADVLRAGPNNSMILLDLARCDRGWYPNFAQRDVMPKEFHHKIEVIPEGVDTEVYRRKSEARNPKLEKGTNGERTNDGNGRDRVLPDGTVVPAGTRIVTYVSRGFELMRGFDIFLEAARRIYETYPDVVFVVAGTDRACYLSDGKLTGGVPLRRRLFETGDYDRSRFHFTGWLPESKLVDLLSVSDLHVYLTAPFITSWSMLDAMSCSCVVLASDQACTREYIEHGRNGLLCDFFDAEGIARAAVEVLRDPGAYRSMREAARETGARGNCWPTRHRAPRSRGQQS
jgi:glycosyltransferase involved in cell wall biosynthesis